MFDAQRAPQDVDSLGLFSDPLRIEQNGTDLAEPPVFRLGMKAKAAFTCPTCGTAQGEVCELNSSQPPSTSHRDPRTAQDLDKLATGYALAKQRAYSGSINGSKD